MKPWLKMLGLVTAVVVVNAVIASHVQAAVPGVNQEPKNVSLQDVTAVLVYVIKYLLAFAAAIAVIFVVVSGYQYILAAGNPEKLEKAKMGLTWAIVGFILSGSAAAIVFLLQTTLRAKQKVPTGAFPGIDRPDTVLERLIDLILKFGGAAAMLFLIIGGFRYITSQGNPELADKAKKTVLYSVIGLAVIMLSYAIFVLARSAVQGDTGPSSL